VTADLRSTLTPVAHVQTPPARVRRLSVSAWRVLSAVWVAVLPRAWVYRSLLVGLVAAMSGLHAQAQAQDQVQAQVQGRAQTTAQATAPADATAAAPQAFFRLPRLAAALGLGPEVLTTQERAFIAGLPEIRVAIPLPAVRPYEVLGPDGEVTGIHPDMLGYLANAFGLRVRPVLFPSFATALEAVSQRQADLMMTLGYTVERSQNLAYTLGVTPLTGALFTRSGTGASPADDADLRSARFAVERNFAANAFIRRQYPTASILTVETTDQALTAVAEGRASHYLGGLLTTLDWLTRQPVPGIQIQRLMNYSSGHYHFAVRKDWEPLATVLNKGISSLRAQGLIAGRDRREWEAVAASLPAGLPLPSPLKLTAPELGVLTNQPVWRVGAVRGLPLMNQFEPNGLHTGIAAEVTDQVARRLGIGVEVKGFDTVGEMLDGLRRGTIDLVPMLTRTPTREEEFAFSQPYVDMPYVIVARSDAPLYWDLNSLRGLRLALAPQHPLRPVVQRRHPEIRIVDVADGREAMDAVADGRADAAVEVKLFANLRINGDNNDRLRTVATVEEVPAQFHFAALQANRPMLGLVDRALQDIPDADLQRMRRRWVAVDLSPDFPWRRWQPLLATMAAAALLLAGATMWWLRRLSTEVHARRRSEQRLRDIAATVPGVAFRDVVRPGSSQRVAGWSSPRALDLLGRAPETGPGGPSFLTWLAALLAPPDAQALLADAQRCVQDGERLHRTVPFAHPDGRRRWLTCEAVRTPAERGLFACTGYVVDTTQEQELQTRLVDAARAHNLTLASASHELRAPAHTLALALQTLPTDGLAPAQGAALRIARDAVDTLTQLLGDVLDAARLDGMPLRLQPRAFELRDVLQRLADGAAAHASNKGLQFTLHVDPALPDRVQMDPLRLRQVVVNLLSNAVKYTARGSILLRAERCADGADAAADGMLITVSDTGHGISPERQALLFTPFASAGAVGRPAPEEGSSGLGLVICRQLTERMGGRLELDSSPGQGTQLRLWLPLPPLLPSDDDPALPTRTGVVLLCDDDDTSRLLLAHLLMTHGFEVEQVDHADAARDRCRRGGVAALITDLEMPDRDGVWLLHAVRADAADPTAGADAAPRPALVVCSGDNRNGPDRTDTDALADARFSKPVDLSALVQRLKSLGVNPGTAAQAAVASTVPPAGD
jgi:two-component system, NarL family, sensor histidine kinase EvgS